MTGKNINLSYFNLPYMVGHQSYWRQMVNACSIRYYCKYKGYPTSQIGFFGV